MYLRALFSSGLAQSAKAPLLMKRNAHSTHNDEKNQTNKIRYK